MRSACIIGLGLIAAGCDTPESDWTARTTRVGDTTIVQTLSGQVWPAAREAVVDLSIGSLDIPTTSFGFIAGLAVNKDGDVFVYDWQVPVIRQFSKTGEFIRQIGAAGRGPGEYAKPIIGIAVRSDGRLQVGDLSNRRITLYNADGTLSATWSVVPPSAFPAWSMMLDARDHTFIRSISGFVSPTEFNTALVHIGPDGVFVDGVPEPAMRAEGANYSIPLSPDRVTGFSADNDMLVGVNNHYEFDVRRKEGGVLRISRFRPLIQLSDEEHSAYDAFRKYLAEITAASALPVTGATPHVKPVYRSLHTTASGNIWVHLYTKGKRKPDYQPAPPGREPVNPFFEPTEFDVFDRNGRYMGPVHAPDGVMVMLFDDDVVWGWRIGSAGEPQVVRMRVIAKEGSAPAK